MSIIEACVLCGHRCRVDRTKGELGKCKAGIEIETASSCLHHGEEPMISGTKGSGTIFFLHCCLKCVFCQNYSISQEGSGKIVTSDALVSIMLELEAKGAHNINLVSPTHYGQQLVSVIDLAREKGLKIPFVYNSGGYDSQELLKLLEGKIEIYLPDFKYSDDNLAKRLSGTSNYVETAQEAIRSMFEQVGNIELDGYGIAKRGLLVRHLVLPGNIENSLKALDFLSSISKDIWVSIMSQYSPQYKANDIPEIARPILVEEYKTVVEYAEKTGLHNLYTQELESREVFLPDFTRKEPFRS
ncbi:MAG: radical SAM protein [Candidatus Margulisiibacteriota bacterium]|jgi:putative pyruvate formate lyase activating enzyme